MTLKGFTLVMALQVFNVFKNKDGRFFCADNTRHIEEKRSLSLTFENHARARASFSCLHPQG